MHPEPLINPSAVDKYVHSMLMDMVDPENITSLRFIKC